MTDEMTEQQAERFVLWLKIGLGAFVFSILVGGYFGTVFILEEFGAIDRAREVAMFGRLGGLALFGCIIAGAIDTHQTEIADAIENVRSNQ